MSEHGNGHRLARRSGSCRHTSSSWTSRSSPRKIVPSLPSVFRNSPSRPCLGRTSGPVRSSAIRRGSPPACPWGRSVSPPFQRSREAIDPRRTSLTNQDRRTSDTTIPEGPGPINQPNEMRQQAPGGALRPVVDLRGGEETTAPDGLPSASPPRNSRRQQPERTSDHDDAVIRAGHRAARSVRSACTVP